MRSIRQFLDTSPTIEEVDEKIQRLRDDIRTLESYRNTRLAIISRLPPEVLSLVFEHTALCKHRSLHINRYQAWLPVSQVCKLWRNVSLNSPRLWGYIYSDTRTQFAELLLERSKSAPIHILSQNYVNRPTFELVLQHSHRLAGLELPDCSLEMLECIAQSKLPILESIALIAGWSTGFMSRFAPDIELGAIPPLRTLSLDNLAFNLDGPFFSHLRTLEMSFAFHSTAHLSTSDVYRVLRNLEYLESLELVNVVDGSASGLSENASLHLPRLLDIRLEVKEITGLAIFTYLTCPHIQSIRAAAREATVTDLAPIAIAIYGMIPIPADRWRVEVSLTPSITKCEALLSIWSGSSEGCEAPFQISVIGAPNFETDIALCSLLPASPTVLTFEQILHAASKEELDIPNLQQLLRELTSVQTLRVCDLEDLVTILSDTPRRTKKQQRDPIPPFSLPSLQHIRLEKVYGRVRAKVRLLGKLKTFLTARHTVNAGIDTLNIVTMHDAFDEDDVEPLRKFVNVLTLSDD